MAVNHAGGIIACHECDHLYRVEEIDAGAKALCHRCGCLLYKNIPNSLNRTIALYAAAFILFILANVYPFLSLTLGGRIEENILLSGGLAMFRFGMGEVGLLIFLTSIGFPAMAILGMLYLMLSIRFGYKPPMMGPVYRMVIGITPWSLISVFMLGVLIAIVKLQDLATVVPGVSLYALIGLLVVFAAARANFDPRSLWALTEGALKEPALTEHRQPAPGPGVKILNCHTCGLLAEEEHEGQRCRRCTAPLHFRKRNSIHRTWALIFTAAILIVPANVYPILTVIRFGQGEPNTIMSGVIHLIADGMWGLAMIVFIASIVVPVLKLIVLSCLLITIQKQSIWRPRDRTLLYRITEVIGAWSMVDIFLVGLLSALVSLDALTTISPGIGASYFGAVVVVTMFAARSFDPRLIWDNVEEQGVRHP